MDSKTTRSFIAVTLYDYDQVVYIRHTDICALYQQYTSLNHSAQDYFINGTIITFYGKERNSIHVRENAKEIAKLIFNAENSWIIGEEMK